ncbi:MAG TPA: DoxX family membrane protein [Verrucomicrobia bacterium]|nr:DoxX family membrane protein [Verrucomicrobiales bacterium]HIL54998.1 DoxX family membrane protein [Verrucomicrobiota bacterium]
MPVWLKSRLDPIDLLFRIILGGIFIYSGIYKISDPQGLELVIRNYKILTDPFIALAAITLPPFEIILGTCLLLKLFFKGAVLMCVGLLTAFIITLSSLIFRGIDIECGCLGLRTTIQMQIFIDSLLLLSALYLLYSVHRLRLRSLFRR